MGEMKNGQMLPNKRARESSENLPPSDVIFPGRENPFNKRAKSGTVSADGGPPQGKTPPPPYSGWSDSSGLASEESIKSGRYYPKESSLVPVEGGICKQITYPEEEEKKSKSTSSEDFLVITTSKLLEKHTTSKFPTLKCHLKSAIHKHLQELSSMEPNVQVALDIAGSVQLLKLIDSPTSHPADDSGNLAAMAAKLLEEGIKLLKDAQKTLRSALSSFS